MRYLLHRIGERINSNFNEIGEIMALPPDTPLSFDGVYTEIWDQRVALARFTDVILFPCGFHAGKGNEFDVGQPPGAFLPLERVDQLAARNNWEIGWHSWNHLDLTKLSDEDLEDELEKPIECSIFAYPYGAVDERVARAVERAGYEEAYSVVQGDGSKFKQNRKYLNW